MGKSTRITLRAEGSVVVAPDRVDLTFRTRAREGDRRRAVEKVRKQLDTLGGVLDGHGVADERRRTESVTATQLIDPKSRRTSGYEAQAAVSIRLDDFTRLGELYHAAATQGDIDVWGPHWQISRGNDGHLEACRRAAASARNRAAAFAEGAGLSLGPLVSLEEEWQNQAGYGAQSMPLGGAAPMGSPGETDPKTMELAGGVMRLSVRVRAVYEVLARADGATDPDAAKDHGDPD